jgi:serine/threonine-protein kinase HipA
MDKKGDWGLSSAYDLTYAPWPGGEHFMTVLGEGKSPTKKQILGLGIRVGLKRREIDKILDSVFGAIARWKVHAEDAGGISKTKKYIASVMQQCVPSNPDRKREF